MSHIPEYQSAPGYPPGGYTRAGDNLPIGAALNETLSIFGRRFVPLCLVMLVIYVPLYFIGLGLKSGMVGAGATFGVVVASIIGIVISVIATLLGQTAATVAVVDDLRHQPFSIGHAWTVTLRRLPTVLGLTCLIGLAVTVGFLLLIVPAFILLVMFYVAMPVCVIERAGATDSLSRSGALTKGQRWRIFAIMLIVGIVSALAEYVIQLVAGMFGTVVTTTVNLLLEAITSAFGAALVAVVYYRLRMLKEGVDIAAIANVFD